MQGAFNDIDPARHVPYKSAVSQMCSMSSIRQVEPMIEECTKIFMGIMSELSDHPINLGEWLQFYTFDVIGAISFNRRFGFLEERRDI
jgi:cytochrome P450